MDQSFSSVIGNTLRQRERLSEQLLQAQVLEDEGQQLQLQYLLDLIDGLLAFIAAIVGSH